MTVVAFVTCCGAEIPLLERSLDNVRSEGLSLPAQLKISEEVVNGNGEQMSNFIASCELSSVNGSLQLKRFKTLNDSAAIAGVTEDEVATHLQLVIDHLGLDVPLFDENATYDTIKLPKSRNGTLNGRSAFKFDSDDEYGGYTGTVWIDEASAKPLKLEMRRRVTPFVVEGEELSYMEREVEYANVGGDWQPSVLKMEVWRPEQSFLKDRLLVYRFHIEILSYFPAK